MVGGDALRTAMRQFPAGVCVVGVEVRGNAYGVTIGSLVSLSLEPALVGISVGRDVQLHELLRDAGAFGISILRGDQGALAAHFARSVPPIAQWVGIEKRTGVTGAPLLADALAWLDCRLVAEHETGDHTFFVGAVDMAEVGAPAEGLVYREGTYRPV
jgi:flavin reductase (DIM6/NTAB) family NADH-FMN oxidoreductase RutF